MGLDKQKKTLLIQIGLFILTLLTTTLAGTEWSRNKYLILGMTWDDFLAGFEFSIPFLLILTVHEFGHYFTARYHKIKVSLPYYIPMWLGFIGGPSLGTMGAFIRIQEHIASRRKYFDVGVSGPVAGFVVALAVLWYGFSNLPDQEFIYEIHPEYKEYATIDEAIAQTDGMTIKLGGNLLFDFFGTYVADPEKLPHPNEIIHYPWLLAGYLALFFTALNLLPIGQLDGGHVVFGLFGGKRHAFISRVLFTVFLFYAGLGWVTSADLANTSWESIGSFTISLLAYLFIVYICAFSVFRQPKDRMLYAAVMLTVQYFTASIFKVEGYSGWLLFSLIIGRFLGVDHPPVIDNRPLSTGQKIMGWLALIIFVLCLSPKPLVLEGLD
ncbi:MAG: site-2 protease family protein [Ekhidna sp.]